MAMQQNRNVSVEGRLSTNPKKSSRPAPPMRRSCQFCRSRKTRCSGDLICTACRTRNISCLYGREAYKGRPRISISADGQLSAGNFISKLNSNSTPTLDPGGASNTTTQCSSLQTLAQISHEDLAVLPDAYQTFSNTESEILDIDDQSQIGASLDRCYQESFTAHHGPQRRVWTTSGNSHQKPTIMSEQCLSILIQGLLDQSVRRFGCLHTQNLDESPTRMNLWFQDRMVGEIPSNFTPPFANSHLAPPAFESLGQYTAHHVSQLMELWFQHHPLSLIISKSLLLHEYRHDTHDSALLAVVLAYAMYAIGSQNSITVLELYQSAFTQIWTRTTSTISPSQQLSTAQILLLLGWQRVSQGDVRQGYCFVSTARTLIAALLSLTPTYQSERINGVEISSVERELGHNIYWISTSIKLWLAIHISLHIQDPTPDLVSFPCSNASTSVVMQLDTASNNYASLVTRSRLTRQLWALAHITNAVTAIDVLHPRTQASLQSSGTEDWQADIARRLHGIPQQKPDVRALYEKIRKVLSDGMVVFQREMGGNAGGILVISAFQILNTTLLFPRDSTNDVAAISERFINEMLESATNIEGQLAAHEIAVMGSSEVLMNEDSLVLADCVAALAIALDTCSRSLNRLHDRCVVESDAEMKMFLTRKTEMLKLLISLQESCGDASLQVAAMGEVDLTEVKKRFKSVWDKVSAMDCDNQFSHLGRTGSIMASNFSTVGNAGKATWQPPTTQTFLEDNGRSGWEPPSLQTIRVPFEKPKGTFGDAHHGFMGDDQVFMDASALDWSSLMDNGGEGWITKEK